MVFGGMIRLVRTQLSPKTYMYLVTRASNCLIILLFFLTFPDFPVFASSNDDYRQYQDKLERVQQSIRSRLLAAGSLACARISRSCRAG